MESYWISEDWSVKVKTFESYLRSAMEQGAIDHLIRAQVNEDGTTQFYIHPANQDGETIDYKVDDNQIYPADPKFGDWHGDPIVMFLRMKSGDTRMLPAETMSAYMSGLERLHEAVKKRDEAAIERCLQDLQEADDELGD